MKKEKIIDILPGSNLTVFKKKHILKVGDKVRLTWNGQILEVVDFTTDGVHHEWCLGDRKTRKASWGYFLFNCQPS